MKYTYDTEFLENGVSIDLISIGIVAEDGREYYAINKNAPWGLIERHTFLMNNVVPSLRSITVEEIKAFGVSEPVDYRISHINWDDPLMKSRLVIARDIEAFMRVGHNLDQALETDGLWAWYADYDHVALCQLWGTMMDLPAGMSMITMDIKQEYERQKSLVHQNRQASVGPDQTVGVHNALEDARHNGQKMSCLGIW